jgi:hypothetical protein
MNHEQKPQPTFKIETVEEFRARGGNVRKVDFSYAHKKYYGFCVGRSNYEENKTEHPNRLQQHKDRLETVAIIKRKIMNNDI